jgi:hypothetical protein
MFWLAPAPNIGNEDNGHENQKDQHYVLKSNVLKFAFYGPPTIIIFDNALAEWALPWPVILNEVNAGVTMGAICLGKIP